MSHPLLFAVFADMHIIGSLYINIQKFVIQNYHTTLYVYFYMTNNQTSFGSYQCSIHWRSQECGNTYVYQQYAVGNNKHII